MASIEASIMVTDNISATLLGITSALNEATKVDIYKNTGIDRLILEMGSLNDMANETINIQQRIGQQAFDMDLLPPNASLEINAATQQIEELGQRMTALQSIENLPEVIVTTDFEELDRLELALQHISQQAANMRLLSPKAVNDINSAGSQFQDLRSQVEQVQKAELKLGGIEQANVGVVQLKQQFINVVNVQQQINTEINKMDVTSVNRSYNQLNSTADATRNQISNNVNAQQKFNNEARKGEGIANALKSAFSKIGGVINFNSAVSFMKDSLDLTNQRIQSEQKLVNVLAAQGASEADFLALKQKAASLQGSTMYSSSAMMGGAAELSTYIKDAEALQHMMGTLSNYAAGMSGGAEVSDSQMVEYAAQLGKALEGSFDGINLFNLTDAQKEIIENGTDMQRALVIDEVINQSWSGLANQMANTPQGMMTSMTNAFNEIRSNLGSQLIPAIMMVFAMIQEHMPKIKQLIVSLVPAIGFVIGLIGGIMNAAFKVYDFFVNNWSLIAPVVWGIVAAFTAWKVITMIQTIKTGLLTAASAALNAVILANPITLIIVAIVAVIAAIAAIIAAIVKWANSVGGFRILWLIVVNAILTAWDLVKIGLFTGIYFVLDLFDKMKLGMMTAGTAIANFMGDMKTNVLMILQNMVNGAINIINGFIGILNKIPGVNIKTVNQVSFGTEAQLKNEADKQARNAALQQARNDIDAGIAERAGKLDTMKTDAKAATANRLAGIDAARAAVQEKEDKKTPSDYVHTNLSNNQLGNNQMDHITDNVANIAGASTNTADNTTVMKNTGEEELRYMRDVAERETINRFTLAEVNFDMGGVTNNVNSALDLDGVVDYIGGAMMERLECVAEGVYA